MTIVVPLRSSYGNGRYMPAEDDYVVGAVRSWALNQPAGVIYCHAAGGTTDAVVKNTPNLTMIRLMGLSATVHVGDLGGNPFGNDPVGVPEVAAAVAYLRAEWGQSGPVVLVGVSQGFVNAANYALRFPSEVAAIAGVVPGIDLADLRTRDAGIATMIDAAYPPVYDDVTDGPTHSPVQFAGDLDPDTPIHLWGSSNDPFVVPATVAAFVAARPQTGFTNIGAVGHSIGGSGFAVAAWVEQFTRGW
jgi:hypothetical protein